MINEFRQCKVCFIDKPILDFTKSREYRLFTCKRCSYEHKKKRLKSPENIIKYEEKKRLTGIKSCKTCFEIKDFSHFHKSSCMKDGVINECKKCHHQRIVKERKNPVNREKFRQYQHKSGLKNRYGITPQILNEMILKQNNRCLICNNPPVIGGAHQNSVLHIDHCHKTGKIRGLLCHLCNRGIGLFREDENLIKKALDYLKSHN